MKLQNKIIVLASILALLPTGGNASEQGSPMGPGASGGGKAVVCRNAQNHILSAELLDLYEGRVLYARQYRPRGESHQEILKQAAERAHAAQPSWFGVGNGNLEKEATFMPLGTRLQPTHDALEVVVPNGCRFEQLAAYHTRLNRLFIDQEIWNSLDELNRAALLLHEQIYHSLRMFADEQDSFYTRQLVAYLLSESELVPVLKPVDEKFPQKIYSCFAYHLPNRGPSLSHFYLYENAAGEIVVQRVHAKKLVLFARTVDTFNGPRYPFGPGSKPLTLEELAGQKLLPRYAGPSRSMGGQDFTLQNASAQLGWIEKFYVNVVSKGQKSKIQIHVGYYRPGTSGDETLTYPVKCELAEK